MSLRLASEIWKLVNESVPYDERAKLAEELVGMLVEYEYDLDDIQYEFDDSDIQEAVKLYADEIDTEEDEYFEDQDQDDEDW